MFGHMLFVRRENSIPVKFWRWAILISNDFVAQLTNRPRSRKTEAFQKVYQKTRSYSISQRYIATFHSPPWERLYNHLHRQRPTADQQLRRLLGPRRKGKPSTSELFTARPFINSRFSSTSVQF